jgi:hypothetical protein
MLDVDTFLTTLYVMVDDFCHSHLPTKKPGPQASLSSSEVITLAIFARWGRFSSERDFYRYARTCLCNAFPTLPDRSQFNRLVRYHTELIEAFVVHLVAVLDAQKPPYEALDSSAMPIRDLSETVSVEVEGMDGWPVVRTSDGPTAWDGMRALACSPPQTLPGS